MLTNFEKSILPSAALMCTLGTPSSAKPMNFVGDWGNSYAYKEGIVVRFNGALYYALKGSKVAPNRNLAPSTNPSFWAPVGTIGNTILSGVVNPTSPNLGQVGDF